MVKIGIGTYQKSDYDHIRQLSSDKESMDETWEDWLENKTKAKQNIKAAGFDVVDVLVKPNELIDYCWERGLDIDSKSRAEFVQWKVSGEKKM